MGNAIVTTRGKSSSSSSSSGTGITKTQAFNTTINRILTFAASTTSTKSFSVYTITQASMQSYPLIKIAFSLNGTFQSSYSGSQTLYICLTNSSSAITSSYSISNVVFRYDVGAYKSANLAFTWNTLLMEQGYYLNTKVFGTSGISSTSTLANVIQSGYYVHFYVPSGAATVTITSFRITGYGINL